MLTRLVRGADLRSTNVWPPCGGFDQLPSPEGEEFQHRSGNITPCPICAPRSKAPRLRRAIEAGRKRFAGAENLLMRPILIYETGHEQPRFPVVYAPDHARDAERNVGLAFSNPVRSSLNCCQRLTAFPGALPMETRVDDLPLIDLFPKLDGVNLLMVCEWNAGSEPAGWIVPWPSGVQRLPRSFVSQSSHRIHSHRAASGNIARCKCDGAKKGDYGPISCRILR